MKLYGEEHLHGLEAAVAYYNSKGGIDGHELVVTHQSSNGDPTTATSVLVKEMSADPGKYTMVDAGAEAAEAAALIPTLKRYPVLGLALSDASEQCATDAESECPNFFGLEGTLTLPETAAADFMKSKGLKKVGILEEAIDFTESETGPMEAALEKDGIDVTTVSYPESSVDLTSQVSQLKGAGVEGIFVEALGAPVGYAVKARAKLGWQVPIVFDIAGSAADITKLAPVQYLKDETYQDIYTSVSPPTPFEGVEEMKKFFPGGKFGEVPNNTPGKGWDEIVVLASAIEQAEGSTSPQDLIKALNEPDAATKSNPLYVTAREIGWSPENHENNFMSSEDFRVVPVGPLVEGEIVPFGQE